VGGESPVRMLVDTAMEIAAGDSEYALLCGAESLKTALALRGAGVRPDWADEDAGAKLPAAEDYVSREAARFAKNKGERMTCKDSSDFPLKPETRAKEIVTLNLIGLLVSPRVLNSFAQALSVSFAGASGFSCIQ